MPMDDSARGFVTSLRMAPSLDIGQAWEAYQHVAVTNGLTTDVATSGVIYAVSDFVAQVVLASTGSRVALPLIS